jgi:hypothetical protein
MSKILIDQLLPSTPFFLGMTYGIQGHAFPRHPWMAASVSALSTQGRRLQILEVGAYAGFSTLTWAQALEECCPQGGDILCVDPWAGYEDGPEEMKGQTPEQWTIVNDDRAMDDIYALFQHNVGCVQSDKVSINHFRAAGGVAMAYLRETFFDIVYVDGSHRYKNVLADLTAGVPLVREGGFLCGDDLERQLHEVDAEYARTHRDFHVCVDPASSAPYHVGVTLAVHEVLGEVANYQGYFVMRRTSAGFEKVDLSGCSTIVPRHFPGPWQDNLRKLLRRD